MAATACTPGITGSVEHTDRVSDAGPPFIDLVAVKVRGRGRSIEVTWTLTQPVSKRRARGAGIELKADLRTPEFAYYEIVAARVGTRNQRTIVRFNGPGPHTERDDISPAAVRGRRVTARVPLDRLPRLRAPFVWAASSYDPQPGVGDLLPNRDRSGRRRLVVFPRNAPFPRPTPGPRPPGVVAHDRLHADVRLEPSTQGGGEVWIRNADDFALRECFVSVNVDSKDKDDPGFSRTFARLEPRKWAYLHTFTFLKDATNPSIEALRRVRLLCKTPRGWGRLDTELPATTPTPPEQAAV